MTLQHFEVGSLVSACCKVSPKGGRLGAVAVLIFFGISCSTAPWVMKIYRHDLMSVLEYLVEVRTAY